MSKEKKIDLKEGSGLISKKIELSEKDRLLAEALKVIEKQYGKGSLVLLGEHVSVRKDVVHTGSLCLDRALGIGGYPRGKIVEVYGPESSGKTTLCLHAVAECQKNGGTCAYIDAEHALDFNYVEAIGVDSEHLYLAQPDDGDQALGICEALVESGAFDLVIVDSVAALATKEEMENAIGETQSGLQAGMLAKSLRKLVEWSAKTKTVVIFVNQLRYRCGSSDTLEVTPGGRALKFFAAVRLDVRSVEHVKKSGEVVGERLCVTVQKNKSAPPFKRAEIMIIYGEGISHEDEILDLGVEYGVFDKTGAWYSYNGVKIGQGRDNAKMYLAVHPEVKAEIVEEIMAMI